MLYGPQVHRGLRMYLRSIHIKNLKLIRDLEIDFRSATGEPRMWTVVIAENGMCKTALLQAIALVASGQTIANQVANTSSLPDKRLAQSDVELSAEFGFGSREHGLREYPDLTPRPTRPPRLRANLHLRHGWGELRGDSAYIDSAAPGEASARDPLGDARGKRLSHWFCAAYGVSRSLPLPGDLTDIEHRLLETRVQNLFANRPILGTNFADIFVQDDAREFATVLRDVIQTHQELLPRIKGLNLQGKGGVQSASRLVDSHRFDFEVSPGQPLRLPATWLSHGYQSTIAWIADVVGHLMWGRGAPGNERLSPAEMEGIVLVDELDAHLHPRWQLTLVQALKAVFPRIQFIVTTHSPLLLGGLAEEEIVRLSLDEHGNITRSTPVGVPAIMTGSELFDTYFGVTRPAYSAKLQRYAFLATDPARTTAEDAELIALAHELSQVGIDVDLEPVPRETRA